MSLPPTQTFHALLATANQTRDVDERVAVEVPIALSYNGISHAVMMATPADLDDFALGFSLGEGIIAHAGELLDIDVAASGNGITLALCIAERRFQALKQHRRTLAGRTGCGLCGQESIAAIMRPAPAVAQHPIVTRAHVAAAVSQLAEHQPLNQLTGAMHAAGFLGCGLMCVREDVGRHNALDKLIGALARSATPVDAGLVVISSRASYEMVHKAAMAGIGIVAAISAPTSLAIQLAEQTGICLIGFAREGRLTIYTHPDRVQASPD
jgi:formate dehydrogenase accessory protein FdhD